MKKGGYDLGRKALYYVVAIMIIALVFVYASNAIGKYQDENLQNLESIKGVGIINKANSCFNYEDKEIGRVYANTVDLEKFKQENLEKCMNMAVKVKLTKLGKVQETVTLTYKEENIREPQTLRKLVTIKEKGKDEEGLLQVEVSK